MEYHIPFLLTFHTDVFLKKKSTRQKRYEVFLNYFDLPRLRPSSNRDWYIYYLRIFWNQCVEHSIIVTGLWVDFKVSYFMVWKYNIKKPPKFHNIYVQAILITKMICDIQLCFAWSSFNFEWKHWGRRVFFFCRRQNVHIFLLSQGSQLTWKWNWLQRKLICNMYRIQFTNL